MRRGRVFLFEEGINKSAGDRALKALEEAGGGALITDNPSVENWRPLAEVLRGHRSLRAWRTRRPGGARRRREPTPRTDRPLATKSSGVDLDDPDQPRVSTISLLSTISLSPTPLITPIVGRQNVLVGFHQLVFRTATARKTSIACSLGNEGSERDFYSPVSPPGPNLSLDDPDRA